MTVRHLALSLWGAFGLVALVASVHKPDVPQLVYNASASVTVGYYRVLPVKILQRHILVLVETPAAVRHLADQRGYLPKSVPMIKSVAALAPDTVCASGSAVAINGIPVASRKMRDRLGRPLPQWEGCHTLGPEEVFLLNAQAPDSFDGRYFGVTKAALIRGKVAPL